MSKDENGPWRPTRNDWVFALVVVSVIVALVLGSSERTTKATPNDEVHRHVTSHAECMRCHGADGVLPQPPGHVRAVQCFQCHQQPEGWGRP